MMLIELIEIGFFSALYDLSNPLLSISVYTSIAVPMLLQIVLLKKYPNSSITRYLLLITFVGMIVLEVLCHSITGWDRLGWLIIYGFVSCIFIGFLVAYPIVRYMNKKARK